MTQLAADNFTSGGRGSPNAWSPASDSNNWTVDAGAGTLSIVSGQGKITTVTALTVLHLGATNSVDFDVTCRIAVNSANYSAAGIIARQTGTTTYYRARFTTSGNTFGIIKTIAGTSTNLSVPAFTPVLNTEYWVRFKGIGPNLWAMIWANGSPVPTSWTATATDSSITTAGKVGVHVNTTTSADIALFDNFYAADYANYEIQQLTSFSAQGSTSTATGFTTTITERLTSFSATATTTAFTSITTTITERLTSFAATASASGSQSQIAQLSSFSALAGVTSSIPLPSTPGVSVLVGNNPAQHVMVKEGSFEIDDSINQVSTCSFTVRDDSGANHFEKGQAVLVNDHVNGIMFTGVVNTSEEDNVRPNPLTNSTIDCQDNHWFPAKRLYKGPEFVEQYAGVIATELLNVLSAEGITAQYASRRETTQTQLGLGVLTNVVAANNVGDGDLELALAGAPVTASFPFQAPYSSPALKFEAQCTQSGGGHLYHYRKIWSGSHTLVANDIFAYGVWISSTSPTAQFGVDFIFSDGSTLRNGGSSFDRERGLQASPVTDLSSAASDQWYTRSFLNGGFLGKTIVAVLVGVEGNQPGTYTAYFRDIKLSLAGGGTLSFFSSTLQQNPTVLVQSAGYSNASVSVVTAYDANYYNVLEGPANLSAAVLAGQSQINWIETGTSGKNAVNVSTSIDNQSTWQTCTNHGAIPSIVPGMNVGSKNLYIRLIFSQGDPDPSELLTITGMNLTVEPSYSSAAKTDSYATDATQTAFSAGILTNVIAPSGGGLTLDGAYKAYATSSLAGEVNIHGAYDRVNNLMYTEVSGVAALGIVRLDWFGTRQNFIAELNVKVDASGSIGLVYRTQTGAIRNQTAAYAYYASVSPTALTLDKGSNNTSGSGTKTNINTITLALTSGDFHRLKLDISGSSHRIYLDDVLYINATDSTYSAAGQFAYWYVNSSGVDTQMFVESMGVCAALTGTRVAPALALSSVGTYGDSRIWWNATEPDTTVITVEASLNSGSTWTFCTNGSAIPGLTAGQSLAGVSVLLRETLNASNATVQPTLIGASCAVFGQISASGTRIGPVLSLLNVGRLGGSVVAWNSATLPGATLGVDTSIDNGVSWQDVTSQNGGSIPGLTGQPEPTIDGFDTNTGASYSNVSLSGVLYSLRTFGGPVPLSAAWAYDTANSRIIASGAGRALYIYNPLTEVSDVDLLMYSEHSDAGGLTWRYTDAANHYELVVQDDSSSEGTPNSAAVYKVSDGTRTLLTSSSVNFTRGTYHISRVTMIASVITVYFDGLQILTVTDGSPLSAGKCGLFTGGGVAYFYQLRIQPLGQDVTALSVMTRWRLATTNPLATPQVLDTSLAAYGNTIAAGALIPQTNYNLDYVSNGFDDLIKQNSSATGNQWWWSLDRNKIFSLLPQTGILAPWVGSSAGTGDFLNAGLKVTNQSDLYRNRQIIKNVLDTVAVDESRVGDGTSTSWTFGNQWSAAPTITVNGLVATVGIKNVDTGRQFYYAISDATITEDSSGQVYDATQTIRFVGTGQFTTYSQYDDLNEQAAFQLVEGGSGIVENVEDGAGITKAAGDQLAKARVMQYGIRGRVLVATTRRYGLAPGQLLPIFLPEHGINDGLFLIRNVKTRLTTEYDPVQGAMIQHGWWTIEGIEGPDLGSWEKLFLRPQ